MPKYKSEGGLLWSSDGSAQVQCCWTDYDKVIKNIVLPEGTKDSSFYVEFAAHKYLDERTGHLACGVPGMGASGFSVWVNSTTWNTYSGIVTYSGDMPNINIVIYAPSSGCSYIEVKNFRIYGSLVYSGTCEPFFWIGDICITVGQILRDVGDRMGTVWFVGDVIQGWFNAIAGYFESARDWFYGLGEWCGQIVQGLQLGDAWTWVLGLYSDFSGAVTNVLGDAWTWVLGLYSDFSGAVTNVLGDAWTWVLGLYSDFSGAVTDALGGTWTWLQGLYSDFSGAVFDVLGSVWNDLQDMHTNFSTWVTGALGGTWTWLTEFINDPMAKLSFDILDLVKSGFEWLTQEWFNFIDTSWDTFKGSFEWLLQKFFVVLEESWDNFEDTLKWLLGKSMDLVGTAAEELKYQIWDMVEKVVKKL